jgi:hypothetical protein
MTTSAPDPIRLSVVIASHNAAAVIETCLAALEGQAAAAAMEVIVVDSSTDETPGIIRRRFPWVQLLHVREPLAIPALRGRGIAASRGDVIAIIDAYSVVAPDWAGHVIAAHSRQKHPVIGGAVDLYRADSASYSLWALYLTEYALFMSPVVRGETWILPGSNLSYKRAALFDGSVPRFPVFWKTNVNWGIEHAGSSLWLEPDIRVELNKPIEFTDFLATRYLHGRCFAGMRVERASAAVRMLRVASTIAVPLLLLWRWTAGFWPKRRRRLRFASTMPAQLLFFAVWAWGEACGYLRGPRTCCEHLYY